MNQVCLNGFFFPSHDPVLHASNRGFAYGDGLFETIKVADGNIVLEELHYQRLFHGMEQMKLPKEALAKKNLSPYILELCELNHCLKLGRVRLAVFRSNEGHAHFLIEAQALEHEYTTWNDEGYTLGIYSEVQKGMDKFASLKSANFLPYVMAGIFATENGWDDAIVLNTAGRVADTSRANIFIVKDRKIITPALNEGCVAGVFRQHLLQLPDKNFEICEGPVTSDDLMTADEVFTTNAIAGLKWVKQIGEKLYFNLVTKSVYQAVISTKTD